MSSADQAYKAKLAARAAGTANAQTYPAGPAKASATLNEADARYQAKLAQHGKARAPEKAPAPAEAKPEEKPEAKPEPKAEKPRGRG